jgi:predicted PurR-regulated permease PerM
MSDERKESRNWSTLTKAIVAFTALVLLGGLVSRFHMLVPVLILALIIAFLLMPAVRFLYLRAKLPWALAANLCFLAFLLIVIGLSTATGLAVAQQLQALFQTVQEILASVPEQLDGISQQTYVLGPWELDFSQFDLAAAAEQLLASVQPILGQASALIASLATGAVESIVNIIFTLAVAYFLIIDYSRIRAIVLNLSIPGYTEDLQRLRIALGRIWNAFLRGQLLVVTSTGFLTWMLMSALGLRFSLGLGVLGGVAKFVPILGPITAGLVAALVALFQPTNWFALTPMGHAILVVISVIILDQSIDYLIVPRIMGASLNLHPVVVLFGLLIGATLAGVLGLLLSAPMMATMVLLGRYTYRKMFDLYPWDPPIDAIEKLERRPSFLLRVFQSLRDRWGRRKVEK